MFGYNVILNGEKIDTVFGYDKYTLCEIKDSLVHNDGYDYDIEIHPEHVRCFHGTTTRGLKAILDSEGTKPCTPWVCSDNDDAMYLWPETKLIDSYGYEEHDTMIARAFESAEIQAVVNQDSDLFVIEIMVKADLLNDDFSCENMSDSASFISCDDFNRSMISNVYKIRFNKWKSPIIVKGLLSNQYFNRWSLGSDLLELAESLPDDLHIKESDFYDYEVCSL